MVNKVVGQMIALYSAYQFAIATNLMKQFVAVMKKITLFYIEKIEKMIKK